MKKIIKKMLGENENKIFCISFPKSGRTWIELFVAKYYSELYNKVTKDILNNGYPKTFRYSRIVIPEFGHGHHNGLICQGIENNEVKSFYKNKKIILLVRDPRNILNSYYHYAKFHEEIYNGDLVDFVFFDNSKENFCQHSSRFGINSVINYMNYWQKNKSLFNSLDIYFYEDIVKDKRILKKYLENLGVVINEKVFNKALEYSSFENMRDLEMTNELEWYGLAGNKKHGDNGLKTRSGGKQKLHELLEKSKMDLLEEVISDNLNEFYNRYKYKR